MISHPDLVNTFLAKIWIFFKNTLVIVLQQKPSTFVNGFSPRREATALPEMIRYFFISFFVVRIKAEHQPGTPLCGHSGPALGTEVGGSI